MAACLLTVWTTFGGRQPRAARTPQGVEKKRAVVAVAHSLLDVFYQLLNNDNLEYHELGGSYFDTLDPIRLRRHLVKCLESLGYQVTLAERKAV